MAELDREYILQRQREGIAIAKQDGKHENLLGIITSAVVSYFTSSKREEYAIKGKCLKKYGRHKGKAQRFP